MIAGLINLNALAFAFDNFAFAFATRAIHSCTTLYTQQTTNTNTIHAAFN